MSNKKTPFQTVSPDPAVSVDTLTIYDGPTLRLNKLAGIAGFVSTLASQA